MALYRLTRETVFPDPGLAEPDGLLAVGGDLSPERLVAAYAAGIFPWYSDDLPILWWSPDPRLVLFPEELHLSRSLRRTLRSGRFLVRSDTAFEQVIDRCSDIGNLFDIEGQLGKLHAGEWYRKSVSADQGT